MKSKGFLALVLGLALILAACGQPEPDGGTDAGTLPTGSLLFPGAVTSDPTEETEPDPGLPFPYELEGGDLIVNSLFQSTILNPDCGDEMGVDIASIELVNASGAFLTSAQITVTLTDGAVLQFAVEDLPAGCAVWAFETGNVSIATQAACESITCEAVYEAEPPLMADRLAVQAEGTSVTVTNLTGGELNDLCLSFHCLFDVDLFLGGKTYAYAIDSLPAGGSTVLEVEECYLGTAQAVRVSQE